MQIGEQLFPFPEAQDSLTKSVNVLDWEHHMVHAGKT